MSSHHFVVLLHGFARTPRDMRFLDAHLKSSCFETYCPRLPTTLGGLLPATIKLEKELLNILPQNRQIHFVGHSMGGLVLRLYLSRNIVQNLSHCVLIATPNRGTELASFGLRLLAPLSAATPSIRDLVPPGPAIPSPLNIPAPKFGIIGGTASNLRFSSLLPKDNDGRVSVASLSLSNASETILLPYNHHKIHHNTECMDLLMRFLKSGTFSEVSTQH